MSIKRTVNEIMELYRWAYMEAIPAFKRMERYMAAYDNIIEAAAWPTLSEIPIPTMFVMVEQALPFTLEYLYPDTKMFSLIPNRPVEMDTVSAVERLLHHTLCKTMNIRATQEPTIRDVYKLGLGYGIVEPKVVYPQEEYIAQVWEGGQKMAERKFLGSGEPTLVENYRYISAGQVIPLPGKSEVDTADGHFIIEIFTETEVHRLYDQYPEKLKASADEIINEARRERFDSRLDLASFLAKLGGRDMRMRPQQRQYMPLIPVMKFYEPDGEYWIANGRTVIYEKHSPHSNMRSGLIKASAWPDGNRWFPVGISEAAERLHYGINVYFNAMMDLFTDHWHPQRIINRKLIPDDAPRDPYADIQSYGEPEKSVGYVQRPQINSAVFTIGELLQKFHAQATGQPDALNGAGSPGMVRSGANSFESLMQMPLGREKIAAAHLETGMLEQTIQKTIILAQALVDKSGKRFPVEQWDEQMKKRYFAHETVSQDDLNNVWTFELNLREKLRSAAADFANKAGKYDRAMKTPQYFDIRELANFLFDDDRTVQRVMLPAAVVQQRQEQEQKMQMMERAAAVRKSGEGGAEGDIQNVPPAASSIPQGQPA